MSSPPFEKARNGDRDSRGRFVRGWRGGPGRPKGLDFRAAIAEHAQSEGINLGEAAWRLSRVLLKNAMEGDVASARLWLDRVFGLQRQGHDIDSTTQTVHVGDQARADLRRLAQDPDAQRLVLDELERRTN